MKASKKSLVLSVVLCLALSVCVASGCASAQDKAVGNKGGASEQVADEGGSDAEDGFSLVNSVDFTERSTGLYPDVQKNSTYQNTGNRGCAACHEDMFAMAMGNGSYSHITTYVGLKDGVYTADCQQCHNAGVGSAGNLMSENIHNAHYSSPDFVENNGNCWSCHGTVKDADGTVQLMLFEEIQYLGSYGGYDNNATSAGDLQWGVARGWETGMLSGINLDNDPDASIELDQVASTEEKEFIIKNFDNLVAEDGLDGIDPATWTLKVEGVANAGEITLEDIKAMPATEITAAQWCLVNGINSAMIHNRPMTGVLLEDFIEALGGLTGGANTVTTTAADGWNHHPLAGGASIEDYIASGAILVYGMYGHDMSIDQGAPLTMFIPGTGGGIDVKNLTNITFSKTEAPITFGSQVSFMVDVAGLILDINTSWFDNDGVQAKVGEPVALEGAAYGWATDSFNRAPAKIMFSIDYGVNWVEVDVPENFDDDQWVHFTYNWTPKEAGTYIVKAKAITADGIEQDCESNLVVVVSE